MGTPETSVILVTYHTGPVLWTAIHAAMEESLEIIIVDNGNPPDIVFRLREFARTQSKVTLLSGHGNIGFARGCNMGAQAAKGKYILLLNPDCILPRNALCEMGKALENYPDAKLAGGYLMNPDGTEQRGGRRNLLTPANAMVESLSLHKCFPSHKKPDRLNFHETRIPDTVHEVPAISGAFMFMRRVDYAAMGGMDERYFLHVEDLDLCMRVAKSGGKTICVPHVHVLHYRSTSDAPSYFVEWHKTKGFIRYFYTHFRNTYVPGFLAMVSAGILVRFGLKSCLSYVHRKSIFHVNLAQREMRRVLLLHRYLTEVPPTNELAGHRYMVSGAVGQVGLCVTGRLLLAGAEVIASTRSDTIPLNHERLGWMYADFDNPQMNIEAGCPDTLIHTAPLWVLPPRMHAFINAGVKRIIVFSSTSLFSKAESRNPHERGIVDKLEHAEIEFVKLCEAHNIEWTLLRPTMIYGVGLDVNITRMASFIHRFHFLPVCPPANGLRQPVHADDLALAVLNVLQQGKTLNHSYNLGGGEVLSYRTMVERIFETFGMKRRILPIPFLPWVMDFMGRYTGRPVNGEMARRMNRDFIFDYKDAAQDFGFQPRGFLTAGKRDLGEY